VGTLADTLIIFCIKVLHILHIFCIFIFCVSCIYFTFYTYFTLYILRFIYICKSFVFYNLRFIIFVYIKKCNGKIIEMSCKCRKVYFYVIHDEYMYFLYVLQ